MNEAALRDWLDGRTASHEFSGSALAWREGGPLFAYRGGLAHRGHRVQITERTRFAVASVTKLVTGTAALRLVDQGRVRLDQALVEVLPQEHRPASLTPELTLHHLLSHTSGLANYHDDEAKTWDSFISCWDRIPMYHLRRPADMLPLFADLPAVTAPGTKYQYADANFILAGLVVEAVAGRSFAEAVAQEVLAPAGMTDTAIDSLDQEPRDLATGYLVTDGPPETWRANTFSVPAVGMPDGGLITTPEDLARFIDALIGAKLLSPAMTSAMMTPHGPPSDDLEQYGYGCELVVEDGQVTIIGHGGLDPGVSAMVAHYRAAGITTVVLCNNDRGSWPVTKRLAEELGLSEPRT